MKCLLTCDLAQSPAGNIKQAIPWLEKMGATCDLLFVSDRHLMTARYGVDQYVSEIVAEEWRRIDAREAQQMAELVELLPAANRGRYLQEVGIPEDVILEKAKHYDLILVASHGRTGLAHLWLGSVAERVVRLSPVPVLVLRWHEDKSL